MNGLCVLLAATLMGWGNPAISFQDEKLNEKQLIEKLNQLEKKILIERVGIEELVNRAITKNEHLSFRKAKVKIDHLLKTVDDEVYSFYRKFQMPVFSFYYSAYRRKPSQFKISSNINKQVRSCCYQH